MLTEKQYRRRARNELLKIGKQCRVLVTDRDVYQQFEREVASGSMHVQKDDAFLLMVRGCYGDSMVARLLRLLEVGVGGISLRRVLEELQGYPELFQERITEKEFVADLASLNRVTTRLKHLDPHLSDHERTTASLEATRRALNQGIDLFSELLQRFYWIIADAHLDLTASRQSDFIAGLMVRARHQ